MRHSFKTISDALNYKDNCPVCKSPLKPNFNVMFRDKATSISFNGLSVLVTINFGSETKLKVTLPINGNNFIYEVYGVVTLESIGEALNGAHLNFTKECEDCRYFLAFQPLNFNVTLKKVHRIDLIAEHINLESYQVYNDFLEQKGRIYDLEAYNKVAQLDDLFDLNKSLEELEALVKTIIIFS